MNRREFLKSVGIFLLGIFFLKFRNLFEVGSPPADKNPPLPEAKYYTRGDQLIG